MTIIHGDCLDEMRKMDANSISCIVTDPPYGISFMGKGWDHEVPGRIYWDECLRIMVPGGFLLAMGGTRTFHRLASAIEDAGYEIRDCLSWLYGSGFPKSHNHFGFKGYGTALKPAWEPIIMAMKPLDGTFAQNAEKWGVAGINVDASRVGWAEEAPYKDAPNNAQGWCIGKCHEGFKSSGDSKGRWPANILFDEEAAALLGERSRYFYCAKTSPCERNAGLEALEPTSSGVGALRDPGRCRVAANNHPTVKPLKLMEYLIRLIAPPSDGLLLDPFAGSGSTLIAAHRVGIRAIGIEKSADYCEIARARLAACA